MESKDDYTKLNVSPFQWWLEYFRNITNDWLYDKTDEKHENNVVYVLYHFMSAVVV